jgi:tRNA (guanine37-N1)-methyltransferase
MFEGFLTESIIKRAIEKKLIEIKIIDFRNYSPYSNNQVDDTIYGGGSGMLLMVEPIYNALEKIKNEDSHIILLSPEGSVYNQKKAKELIRKKHIILICGHYEGFDERIKKYVNEIISIGEFVLTGGEIPSMLITDSVIRLVPGVINEESLLEESFNDQYYDYPKYTKPRKFDNQTVPDVLLNGNHEQIKKWRCDNKRKIK